MGKKTFRQQQSVDFEIVEDDKKVAELRIKPNKVLIKGKGEQTFNAVGIEAFLEFAQEKGEKQKQ